MKKTLQILMMLFVLGQIANGQVITSIAGNSLFGGFSGDSVAATATKLNQPFDVAMNAAGDIFIADYYNNRVRKIDHATGLIYTVAGTGVAGFSGDDSLATLAKLHQPSSVAIDAAGNIYISDDYNSRIRKVTVSTGIITTYAGTFVQGYNGDGIAANTAKLNWPKGIRFDSNGNLFIADWYNQRIRKIDHSTGLISTVAGNGTIGFSGDNTAATGAQINYPYAVVVNTAGDVIFTDSNNNRIRKVDHSTGIITTIAGTGTAGFNGNNIAATSANLSDPVGLAITSNGSLLITDSCRIRKINSSGIISTVAGNGNLGFTGDNGLATSAELNLSVGIMVDPNGNLLIADNMNYRVRKVTNINGMNEINNSENIAIYPNPSNGKFSFSYQLSTSKTKINVSDIKGNIVYSKGINVAEGTQNINLSNLDNGIYFMELTSEKGILATRKLEIVK